MLASNSNTVTTSKIPSLTKSMLFFIAVVVLSKQVTATPIWKIKLCQGYFTAVIAAIFSVFFRGGFSDVGAPGKHSLALLLTLYLTGNDGFGSGSFDEQFRKAQAATPQVRQSARSEQY